MKNSVLLKVFIAILLAVVVGWITGPTAQIFGVTYVRIFGLIGQLFLNSLMLVVVPLVTASIITGTAKMGGDHAFGVLGAKTFSYYFLISLLAVLVGTGTFLIIDPAASLDISVASKMLENQVSTLPSALQGDSFDKISQILLRVVPSNIFAAASQGQMLGMIVFSILFGLFLSKIESHPASIVTGFFKGVFQIMMKITHFFMRALPIGVFGLVAKVVASTGLESLSSVALFTLTVISGLLIFSLIILPLLLAFIAKVNPILHFRAMGPALLTAFSTSSSAASIPVTIECVEKRAGVSNRICSFIIPLGTSFSLSGSAMHQCVASLFIAQVYGFDLSIAAIATIVIMALLTSFGMAGIPSASLISTVVILQTIGVPIEGVGLVMAIERILDMCRTTVNVLGNTCCAVLVAKSEGEKEVLAATPLLSPKVTE